jgi:hypothetical protein
VKRHVLELLRADAEGFGIPMGFVHPILGPWKNIRKNSFLNLYIYMCNNYIYMLFLLGESK